MSPRTGRPLSDNPKKNDTRLRMTDLELEKLNYCAKQMGKAKSEILLLGVDKIYEELQKGAK